MPNGFSSPPLSPAVAMPNLVKTEKGGKKEEKQWTETIPTLLVSRISFLPNAGNKIFFLVFFFSLSHHVAICMLGVRGN